MRILKRSVLTATVAAIALSLSACGQSAAEKLAGKWEIDDGSSAQLRRLEFFADGKYASNDSNYEGDYSVDGDRLYLEGILVDAKTYTFDIDGDRLTLYKSDDVVEAVYNRASD